MQVDLQKTIILCAKALNAKHSDFSIEECKELCITYCEKFSSSVKIATIKKSLMNWIEREFGLPPIIPYQQNRGFTAIPHHLLGTKNTKTTHEILTQAIDIEYSIGTNEILKNCSFQIHKGSKISLIGKNGAGKSTLLKMLIGKIHAEYGSIEKFGNYSIGYLSQEILEKSVERTLREEMQSTFPLITDAIKGLQLIEKQLANKQKNTEQLLQKQEKYINFLVQENGYALYDLQTKILSAFGFKLNDLDRKIGSFSGGEQTKIQIAKCIIQDVEILILDEPTNHLDISGILFLENLCKNWNKTLICISHDRRFLNNVFETTRELEGGKIQIFHSNYDNYIIKKEENYIRAVQQFKTEQKEQKKQERFIERFRYKASKATQVQSRIKQIKKKKWMMEPDPIHIARDFSIKIDSRLVRLLFRFKSVTIGYDKALIQCPPTLDIVRGSKIGIIGPNGSGKTSFLKTMIGEIPPLSGQVNKNSDVTIGYYSQVIQNLSEDASIIETLSTVEPSINQIRSHLGSIGITGDTQLQTIGSLSGGEKAKVALIKMILQKPHLIVMDEPTNHLDIIAKDTIIHALSDFDGVSVIVSHDRDFIAKTCNMLWVIDNNSLTQYVDIETGLATYLQKCMEKIAQ